MRLILTLLLVVFSTALQADGGLLRVDWTKETSTKQKLIVLPKVLKNSIKDVTLPVYIPRYYIHKKDILVVADSYFYTITIPLNRAMLMITGDRTYQRKILSKDNFKLKSIGSKFISSEGMMSIDFQRNGVNYTLSIECEKSKSDKRCIDKKFLKKIYSELIFIGGKR